MWQQSNANTPARATAPHTHHRASRSRRRQACPATAAPYRVPSPETCSTPWALALASPATTRVTSCGVSWWWSSSSLPAAAAPPRLLEIFFLLSPARKRSRGRDLSARGAGQVACGRVSRAVPRQSHSSASRRRPAWLLAGKLGRGGGVCDLRCGTTVTLVEVLWMSSLLRTCVCLVLVSRYLVWLPGASSSNCQQTWQAHSYCCI